MTGELVTREGFQTFLFFLSPLFALLGLLQARIRGRKKGRAWTRKASLFYGLLPLTLPLLWLAYAAWLDRMGMNSVAALSICLILAAVLGLVLGRALRGLENPR